MSDDLISNLKEMLGTTDELSSSSSESDEEDGSGEDDDLFSQLSSMMADEPAPEADEASGSSDEEATGNEPAEQPLVEVSVRLVDSSLQSSPLDAAESSDEEPNAIEALATEQAEAERLATEQAEAEAIAAAKRADAAEQQARAAAAEAAKQAEEERQAAENAERAALAEAETTAAAAEEAVASEMAEQQAAEQKAHAAAAAAAAAAAEAAAKQAERERHALPDKTATPDAPGSSDEECGAFETLATDQPELGDSDVGEFSDGGTARPDYDIGQFLEDLGTNPLVEELFLDAEIDTLGQLAEAIHRRSDLEKFLTKPEWVDQAWAEVKRINLPTPPANDVTDTATRAGGRTANPAAVEESSDEESLAPQDEPDPNADTDDEEEEEMATAQKKEVIATTRRPDAAEHTADADAAAATAAKQAEADQLAAENAKQAAVETAPLDAAESSDEEPNAIEALVTEQAEAERLATEQAEAEAIAAAKRADAAEQQARAAAAEAAKQAEEERQAAENAERAALAEAETTAAAAAAEEAVASEMAEQQAAEQKAHAGAAAAAAAAAAAEAAAKQAERERLAAENVTQAALAETALAGAEIIASAKQAVATEIARLQSVELEVQQRQEAELEVARRWEAEHGTALPSQAEQSQPAPKPEPELNLVPDELAEMPKWGTPSRPRSRASSSRSRNETSRSPTRRQPEVQARSPKQARESVDKLYAAHERLLQKREHARETHFQEVDKQLKAKSPPPATTNAEQRKFTERVNKNAAGHYNFKDSVKLQQQLKVEVQKKREQRARDPHKDPREERESKGCTFKPQLSNATVRMLHQKQREQVESKPDKELLGAWRVILPTKLHPNSEPAADLDFRPANDVEYKVAQVGDTLRVTRVTRTPKGLRLHTNTHWVHSFTAKHGFRMVKKSTSKSLPGCVTHKTTSMILREAEGAKRRDIASDVRKMLDRAAARGELLSSDFGEQERTRRERNWHLRELRADVVKLDSAQRDKQLEHAMRIRHEQHEFAAGTTPRQRRALSPPELSFNTVDVNFPIGGPHIPPELQRAPTSTRSTSHRVRTPSRVMHDTLPADRSSRPETRTRETPTREIPTPIATTQQKAVVATPERLLTVLSTAPAAQEAAAAETVPQDDVELEIQRRWEAAHGAEPQQQPEPEPEPEPEPRPAFEATDQDVAARQRMQMLLHGLKQLNSLSDQMTQKLGVDGQDEVAASTYAETVMAAAEDWLCGEGPVDATHQQHRPEASLAASVDGVPLALSSAAVAHPELEVLQREIRELGEGIVADVLDQQAIEQAIENKRRRRPAPAGRTASGTAESRKKGSRNKRTVPQRGQVQPRVDTWVRRETPTGRQQQQRSPLNAGPMWQELRAETLRQDGELSAFIAGASEQASQHEKRMVEEWTQPASGVDSVMHQLHGELQLMRSLVHDDVGTW